MKTLFQLGLMIMVFALSQLPIYSQSVDLLNGLQSYWKLDGDLIDSYGSNNWVNYGSVNVSAGKINEGRSFNEGTTTGQYCEASSISLSTAATMSFWVYSYGPQPTTGGVLFKAYGSPHGDQTIFGCQMSDNDSLYFSSTSAENTGVGVSKSVKLNQNLWYHFVWVFDGPNNETRLFVNGNKTSIPTSFSTLFNPISKLKMGMQKYAYRSFHGKLDEIGIWDRALNDEEALALYNNGNGFPYPFITQSVCTETIPFSQNPVTQSELVTLMQNDGISSTLINSFSGNYVYRIVINGGGDYYTKTWLTMCLDGKVPVAGIAKGESDDIEPERTRIGTDQTFTNLYDFNNLGWVDVIGYTGQSQLFMELNSKWGTDIDTWIYYWIATDEPIENLGYSLVEPHTSGFGSVTVDGYQMEQEVPTCTETITIQHNTLSQSGLDALLQDDGVSPDLIDAFSGNYVYRIVINGGGDYYTKTWLTMCLDGKVPVAGIAKGESDDIEPERTRIGTDQTYTNLYDFNNLGWVDVISYTGQSQLFMELNSKWGTDIDTWIYYWIATDEPIENLGYGLVEPHTSGFGSVTVDGYELASGSVCDPGWEFVQTISSHTIAIPLSANPTLFGEPLEPGDYIGVFYIDNNGNEACGGYEIWTGDQNLALTAYGDDNTTPVKEGFAANEEILWKVYDCSSETAYKAFVTYDPTMPNYNGLFASWGLSRLLSLVCMQCQTLSIPSGWSGVSLYVTPSDPSVENIFAPIVNDLVLTRNINKIYWPSQSINTIGNWDNQSGYAIKLLAAHDLEICGTPVTPRVITLNPGWHYLPVLSECPANTMDLFGSVLDDIVIVQEIAGSKVFWPAFQIYSLNELQPGKGYAIKVLNQVTLTYPACTKANQWENTSTINHFISPWNEFDATAQPHFISIDASLLSILSEGDVIGVVAENGKAYGSLVINSVLDNHALVIYGDDPTTLEKDGFSENEMLEFRLWKAETNKESILDVSFNQSMPNPEMAFRNNGISSIARIANLATGINQLGSNLNVQIIPNPVKDEFVVTLNSEKFNEGTIIIYTIDGQKLRTQSISQNKTNFNISDLSPGIYILNIVIDGNVFNKRLVKQ